MSDFNSSLPVRTETAGDLQVKIVDSTIPAQGLTVEADGSINVNVSATDLDIRDLAFATDKVDVSGSEVSLDSTTLAALENITVSATDLDIRNLVFATDKIDASGSSVSISGSVTVTATDLDIRNLTFAQDKVDASGSSVALDAPTLAALESVTVQNGAGASAVNIQDGGNSITVDANNLDIRDLTHVSDSIKLGDGTDFLAINTDGSINVAIVDASPGTAVNDYNTVASVAAAGSSTHTYTSTGNFYLQQIEASASGKMKIEIQVNGTTRFVQFNSTSETNMSITLTNPILVTNTQTVTVIRTNRDNQSQDVYSTISGYLA